MRKHLWIVTALMAILAQCSCFAAKRKPQAEGEREPPRIIKKRIAVMPVNVEIQQWHWAFGPTSVAGGLTEMLTTALVDTGRFVVVERAGMDDVLAEQQLAQEGVTTKETGAKRGRVIGAEYLVRANLTEFEYSAEGGGGGIRIKGFRIGGRKAKARLGLDVRVYNSSTSQVMASKHITGAATRRSGSVFVPIGSIDVKADGFKKSPLGGAMRDAVRKWVDFIVEALGNEPWRGRVVKVDGDRIYVNGGGELGVRVGDLFEVWREGEPLIDPETGLELGRESERVGSIRVTQVFDKYAIAEPVEGETFERGDVVAEVVQRRHE
ncbi:MAG: CsgG/HfaB family protein [Armatimonadota bacterium]